MTSKILTNQNSVLMESARQSLAFLAQTQDVMHLHHISTTLSVLLLVREPVLTHSFVKTNWLSLCSWRGLAPECFAVRATSLFVNLLPMKHLSEPEEGSLSSSSTVELRMACFLCVVSTLRWPALSLS